MADVFNKWGTISFRIPDFLEDIRDVVNNFAELLVTFLEVANLALEFVKSFVKAFLDPLVAIIEAIIAEITAFLRDLRQIGIYITGDWTLLGWPPEDLRGGFAGYERRMISRLVDRTDPTRPDVSSATKVVGLFGYLSVDPSDFERLINFIISFIRLFGLSYFPDTSAFPVPSIQNIQYGGQAVGGAVASFQFSALGDALGSWDKTPPRKCRVTWVAQPASLKHPLNPFPALGPSGYLVTVSTLPEGIPLKFARPRANTDKKGADGDKNKQVQPREYGDVRDPHGQPLILHGGMEMLDFIGSGFEYNAAMSTKEVPKDGYCQVFGVPDAASNEVIPLETLGPATDALGTPGDGKGSDYLLQRTFLVTEGVTLAQWFAGEYSTVFDIDDMPHHARWEKGPNGEFVPVDEGVAPVYYVRVWATGSSVADEVAVPKWDFQQPRFNAATAGQPFVVDLKSGVSSIGYPSAARKMPFVGAHTQEYLEALQTALLVLILTRSDLPTLAEIEATKGKEVADQYREGKFAGQGFVSNATGLEDSRKLLDLLYSDIKSLEVAEQNPLKWRSDVYDKVRAVAQDMYEKAGLNAKMEQYIVDATPDLRAVTVGEALDALQGEMALTWQTFLDREGLEDPTLLEAFDPDNAVAQSLQFGFAPNVFSTGMSATDADELFYLREALPGRATEFTMYEGGDLDMVYQVPADHVTTVLNAMPLGVRRVFEKFLQEDGSLNVPDEWRNYLEAKKASTRYMSSGDLTPVLVVDIDTATSLDRSSTFYETTDPGDGWPGVVYARGLMRAAREQQGGGQLLSPILAQAALVLRVAGVERPPADGEWIAIRLFDAWPELEDFLRSLENWVKILAEAVRSIADAIIRYIEFVQAQIVELQQLIRRINALIQSFLTFAFALPQFSGLLLLSNGTDGLVADLVAAENKPSDTPLSYGGGVGIVVPFAPSFIFDIIELLDDEGATASTERPPDPIGIEQVEPEPGAPPSDEPDVL